MDILGTPVIPEELTCVIHRPSGNVMLAGKSPRGFYFYYASTATTHFFYKSQTKYTKNAHLMSRSEENQLLDDLMIQLKDKPFSDEYAFVSDSKRYSEAYWVNQDIKQKERMEVFQKEQEAKKSTYSNAQATARKFAQKEKILDRWSDIAPVFLDSAHKEIGAKINGRYVYINLDDQKPEFLLINKTNTQPMSITDLAQFMGVLGENKGFESVAEHIAIYYQKFSAVKAKRARPKRAHEIDIKIKNALYDKIEFLSNASRAQMAKRVQEQLCC